MRFNSTIEYKVVAETLSGIEIVSRGSGPPCRIQLRLLLTRFRGTNRYSPRKGHTSGRSEMKWEFRVINLDTNLQIA